MGQPAQLFNEKFDLGLNTSQDPATLESGELTKADNVVYWPSDNGLHKIRGRTTYGTISATNVVGLRYLAFDNADNIIVALGNNGTYFYSVMTTNESGFFSTLYTGAALPGNLQMESVQYNNRHYLFNGAAPNISVNSNYAARSHGLSPVTDAAAVTGVAGSWNTSLGPGYYFFLTTEVLNPGTYDEVESTNTVPDTEFNIADGKGVFQITVANQTTTTVQITRPGGSGATSTINPTATEWRVYMAGPYTDRTPVPVRNVFKLVARQNIGTLTVLAGNIVGTALRFPTANAIISGGWTNPNNAQANDNVFATTNVSGTATQWKTFGFAVAGTISGIEVVIKVSQATQYPPGFASLQIALTPDGTNFFGATTITDVPFNQATRVFGSNSYLWGRTSWTPAEVNAATFGVAITVNRIGSFSMPTVSLDYVAIRVYTTGSSTDIPVVAGTFFPTISISEGGVQIILGSHGAPPVAYTADIFEDQLVTNDISDASIIRYSLPNQPDYFPSPYFLNFETREADVVTCIRKLGNKLLVGHKTQLFRVNYLPRESDAEFDRGRCYEPISTSFGIVGPQAATVFSPPEGPTMLAFVSYSGIHMTDGFQIKTLTDNIDWDGIFGFTSAGNAISLLKSVLIDYPNKYWLVFYYPASGATFNKAAYIIHYHPSHIRPDGTYKITGPISTHDVPCATMGRTTNLPVWLTGAASTARVYVEDRGYTDSSGVATAAVDVRTREIYPYGIGSTQTIERIWLKHDQDTSPGTATGSVTVLTREGDNAQITRGTKTFTTAQAGLVEMPFKVPCESFVVKVTESGANAPIRFSHIAVDAPSRGKPEGR